MDTNTALIIANVFIAASFLAEKRAAWWATMVFGWFWLTISIFAK